MKNALIILICLFLSVVLYATRATGSAIYGPLPVNTTQTTGQSYALWGPLRVNTIQRPIFSLAGGSYSGPQTISLSSSAGSIIYTLNGSDPGLMSGMLYSGPITIATTTTIKAVTYIAGAFSPIASASYSINQAENILLTFEIAYSDPTSPPVSYVHLVYDINGVSKNVISNTAYFSELDLWGVLVNNVKGIELFAVDDHLIGHMAFEYTQVDRIVKKKVHAQLIVHGQHQPYNDSGGDTWSYYQTNERMVSMLIMPQTIRNYMQPLVMVHGINGKYPYFPTTFKRQLNGGVSDPDNGLYYDIWEFYYPYDQQIEQSAPLLGDAISRIKSYNYPAPGRVHVLAHSMGGLVTRQLIQSAAYQTQTDSGYYQSIGKFVMLGTPNHGSHSIFMAYNQPLEGTIFTIALQSDAGAPAVKQLFPGSSFLMNLNSQSPLPLYQGASLQNSYLVIAGTNNPYSSTIMILGEVHLPPNNDDMVVSVPSASLLEYSIPLGIVNHDHAALMGDRSKAPWQNPLNPQFLNLFYSNNYNAYNTSMWENFNGFYLSPTNNENLAAQLQVKFNITLPPIINTNLFTSGSGHMLQLRFGLTDYPNNDTSDFIHNNWLRESNSGYGNEFGSSYFLQQKQGGFLRQSGNLPSGEYDIQMRNYYFLPFQSISSAFSITTGITTMVGIDFTDGEYSVATLNNTNACLQRGRYRDEQSRSFVEEQYYIDSSTDKMVFYVGGEEGLANFAQHNAYLIDPSGDTIDPISAQNDPEMEFQEDLDLGYAYYYVHNPETGLWKLRYNDSIPNGLSQNLIDSPYSIQILVPEDDYVYGDVVGIRLPLPATEDYSEPSYTLSLRYLDPNGLSVNLGSLTTILNSDDECYESSFIPTEPGLYTVCASFQCLAEDTIVRRYSERSVEVSAIRPPAIIYPAAGTGNLPTTISLSWEALPVADSYQLTLYEAGNNEAILSLETSSASCEIENLNFAQEYLWQVSASNAYGSSAESTPATFYTKPAVVNLISPANAAANLPQTVLLNWEAVNGAIAYRLQLAQDSLFDLCLADVPNVSGTNYELNGLGVLQSYYWRAAALDQYGQGAWSETYSFSTRDIQIAFPAQLEFLENTSQTLYLHSYIDNFEPGLYQVEITGNSSLAVTVNPERVVLTPPSQWFGTEELLVTVRDLNASRKPVMNAKQTNLANRELLYQALLLVTVSEVNDSPVLTLGEDLLYWNGETIVIDLADCISDPDTPISEIQIEIEGGANLGLILNGTSLYMNPDPAWYGYDFFTIQLSDSRSGSGQRSGSLANRSLQSYEIMVNIVNSKPSLTGFTVNPNEVLLSWQSILGAEAYHVFRSNNSESGFVDITGMGSLQTQGNIVSWRQLSPADRAFYYIKASKDPQDAKSMPARCNK